MRRPAFTLIEMIAVILIMALGAAIAVPNLARMVESQKKRNFLSGVDRLIVKAREMAVRSGQSVVLATNGDGGLELRRPENANSDEPSSLESLSAPNGISISRYDLQGEELGDAEWQASFYPDGKCDDAGLEIQEGNTSWQVRLDPATGTGYLSSGELEEAPIRRWEAGQLAQRT